MFSMFASWRLTTPTRRWLNFRPISLTATGWTDFYLFLPSQLAAAAVFIARRTVGRESWSPTLLRDANYSQEEIAPVARAVLAEKVATGELCAVNKKYVGVANTILVCDFWLYSLLYYARRFGEEPSFSHVRREATLVMTCKVHPNWYLLKVSKNVLFNIYSSQ